MIDKTKIKLLPVDRRSQREKNKEIDFHNKYGIVAPEWVAKTPAKWHRVMQRDQDGSSSCEDHSIAENIEAQTGIVVSAKPMYSRRPNEPDEGTIGSDGLVSAKNQGTTLESICPSNGLNEVEMDALVTVPTLIKASSFGGVPVSIESIAQAIAQHKAVVININLSWQEWEVTPGIPQYIPGATIDGGHGISGQDNVILTGLVTTIYNGQKAIIAQNHWGKNDGFSINGSGLIILTESYLIARCSSVYYLIMNQNTFMTKSEIIQMQTYLNTKMPPLVVDGIDGPKTQKALEDFIGEIATKNGVEPSLAIAVATCEGGMNPFCVNVNTDKEKSEDRGMYQFNSFWHKEITDAQAFDIEQSTILFCNAVKAGFLKTYWSASMHCWSTMLTPEIKSKYAII